MRNVYVYVRTNGARHEWRIVKADSLEHAFRIADAMPDVNAVLEASWVPGGVVT